MHGATLAAHYWAQPRFDISVSISAFMLLTAIVGRYRLSRRASWTLLLAFSAAAMMAPLLFVAPKPPPPPQAFAHILPAMLAYSFAVLAMLQWADLLRVEHARRRLEEDSAPPLLALEAECFRTLFMAFVLLSAALLTGFLLSPGGAPAHKTLFAVLAWLSFGGLLLGRRLRGWRGHIARRWLSVGFLFFILSYFGTHFVLQVLLGRTA